MKRWLAVLVLLAACADTPTESDTLFKKQTVTPTTLTATVAGVDIALAWTDGARGETGYQVQRDGTVIATLQTDAEAYLDRALEPGAYCYEVRSFKQKKQVSYSAWSNEACGTVDDVVEPPPPPPDTTPPPPPPPGDGIPFGPSRFDVTSDYPFNASLYHRVHAGREESELSPLVANDKRASVNMVGGKGNYKNPDETFNVDMWKAELDEFDVEIVQKYVDNGTIVAHYALDEPHAGSQWSGDDVDPALVDEAACYSKSKWPNLPVLIRTHPGWAVREEGAAHDFQCVDIWVAQYSSRKGPIDEYVAQNVADAAALGAQLYGALNPITGGDGSSGVASPVWDGKWMMSADEVRTYGEAWMNAPIAGFSAWYWGWGVSDPMDWYWLQPEIRAAVEYLFTLH